MKKKFHGFYWSDSSGRNIHIGSLPGRKSIALYIEENAEIKVLAYFISEEAANMALDILDAWS